MRFQYKQYSFSRSSKQKPPSLIRSAVYQYLTMQVYLKLWEDLQELLGQTGQIPFATTKIMGIPWFIFVALVLFGGTTMAIVEARVRTAHRKQRRRIHYVQERELPATMGDIELGNGQRSASINSPLEVIMNPISAYNRQDCHDVPPLLPLPPATAISSLARGRAELGASAATLSPAPPYRSREFLDSAPPFYRFVQY